MIDPYKTDVKFATSYRLQPRIDEFVRKFDNNKKSVILLVGGAASQLLRADQRFDDVATPSQYFFDPVWIDIGITMGDAKALEINRTDDRDQDAQIIVADGDIQFYLGKLRPYKKAMKFFTDEFNALLLGWDWRRNIQTAVDMLNDVMTEILSRTGADKKPRVMQNIFIVGHSMGGMVAKLYFTQHSQICRQLGGMISVGTPFYGYINELQRIYEGVKELNQYYPARKTAKIYSSLTGLYSLLPIDYKTYERDGRTSDLTAYPVTDGHGTPADPFHKTRPIYPEWFRDEELPAALLLRGDLASPLPSDLSKAVFHLRTVKVNPPTPVAATWRQDRYNPDTSGSPVEIQMGKGDETIPEWSSRLASTPPENVHHWDKGEHSTLMEQDFVLRKIFDIVTNGKWSMTEIEFKEKYGQNPEVATTEELETFRQDFKGGEIRTKFAWRILQNTLM